ncbi:MAG: SIMPL domain-containing protein [Gemmatimonadetes bacterium]|nr:SIMPL domain-containing protein [Gemmatimonadota bacterium]
MIRSVVIAFVFVPLCAASAGAQAVEAGAASEVVSSASAERAVSADLATVTLRFSRTGLTPSAAGRALALKADSIRAALAVLGIPRDSVVNGSRWYWWRGRVELVETEGRREDVYQTDANGNRHLVRQIVHRDTSYRMHEQLEVRIRDVSRVGRVIDAALAVGITDIGEVAFSATNTEAAQREAIRMATERARARAEVIAAAGGGRLGRTLRLSTEGGGEAVRHVPYLGLTTLSAQEAGPGTGATVVVAPVLKVTATVHGRWVFVQTP